MFLTSQLSKRLQNTSRQVTNLAFLDVAGRIAQALNALGKTARGHDFIHDGMQIKNYAVRKLVKMVGCSTMKP